MSQVLLDTGPLLLALLVLAAGGRQLAFLAARRKARYLRKLEAAYAGFDPSRSGEPGRVPAA